MYVEKQDKQMRAGRTKQIPLGISTVSKEEGCVCMKMSQWILLFFMLTKNIDFEKIFFYSANRDSVNVYRDHLYICSLQIWNFHIHAFEMFF